MERFLFPIFAFFGLFAGMFVDAGPETESVTQHGKVIIESD